MIRHTELGIRPFERSRRLKMLIDTKQVTFAGNNKLKIYGKLNCSSGNRMNIENRVFFASEARAIANGFRPCGHCLKEKYAAWKGAAPNDL